MTPIPSERKTSPLEVILASNWSQTRSAHSQTLTAAWKCKPISETCDLIYWPPLVWRTASCAPGVVRLGPRCWGPVPLPSDAWLHSGSWCPELCRRRATATWPVAEAVGASTRHTPPVDKEAEAKLEPLTEKSAWVHLRSGARRRRKKREKEECLFGIIPSRL